MTPSTLTKQTITFPPTADLASLARLDEHESGDTGSRLIHIWDEVCPTMSGAVISKLLEYENESSETPIHLFIFSPGGCVISGLSIIDTIRHIEAPVFTYAIGYAASMGAVILSCGSKGHRYVLPHSRVMIHQARGSAGGNMDNLRATLAYQMKLEEETTKLLAETTGKSPSEICDASRVDNWLSAQDALDFGLVDHILAPHPSKIQPHK